MNMPQEKFDNEVLSKQLPWFMDTPVDEERIAQLSPTVRQHVRNIVEQGYTVIKSGVSKEICADTIERFRKFAESNDDKFRKFLDSDGHYPRIANLHAAFTPLTKLFSHNRVTYEVQKALFGAEPALYTSLFYERGSAQPIHRDTPYFTTKPEYFYLGVWVALEDAGEENGALEVVPGGHAIAEFNREAIALQAFPSLESVPSASDDLWNMYQARVMQACNERGLQKKLVSVEQGDTVIWHPQLPHGGSHIRNLEKTRFSFVMHTTPRGVPVYHHDVFFNPTREVTMHTPLSYVQHDGCYFAYHDKVDFGHRELFQTNSFKQA